MLYFFPYYVCMCAGNCTPAGFLTHTDGRAEYTRGSQPVSAHLDKLLIKAYGKCRCSDRHLFPRLALAELRTTG